MAKKTELKKGDIVVVVSYKDCGDAPGTITKVISTKESYFGFQHIYCHTDILKFEIKYQNKFVYGKESLRLATKKEVNIYNKRKKGTMTVLSLPSANITSKGNKIKSDNKNVKVKRTDVGCYEVKARIPAI